MKRALICWELGAGFGHLNPISHVSEQLIAKGYQVWIASRELQGVHRVFEGCDVHFIQAPVLPPPTSVLPGPAHCFAHLLESIGYNSAETLRTYLRAWQSLFDLIQPDVSFFDHSPTALIASLPYSTQRIYLGSTFSSPPAGYPFALFQESNYDKALTTENKIVQLINEASAQLEIPALNHLEDLFVHIDHHLFTTIEELDHYPDRPTSEKNHFVSVATFNATPQPNWPDKGKIKVFAYLKPSNYIIPIINWLIKNDACALIYLSSPVNFKKPMPDNIRVISQPVSMKGIAESADVVINNTNLNTVIELLGSRTPQLLMPLTLEQSLLTHRLVKQNLGKVLDLKSGDDLQQHLSQAKACKHLITDALPANEKLKAALNKILE